MRTRPVKKKVEGEIYRQMDRQIQRKGERDDGGREEAVVPIKSFSKSTSP